MLKQNWTNLNKTSRARRVDVNQLSSAVALQGLSDALVNVGVPFAKLVGIVASRKKSANNLKMNATLRSFRKTAINSSANERSHYRIALILNNIFFKKMVQPFF